MESLVLVTSNAEEARTWITGLRYLMAGISDEDSLAKRQRTHDQYPSNKKLAINQRFVPFVFISFGLRDFLNQLIEKFIEIWTEAYF